MITQKKTCNGCRAGYIEVHGYRCSLGYPVDELRFHDVVVSGIPQGPCPKPKTNKAYVELEIQRREN